MLRGTDSHHARLIDEDGQTQGVIALEDILEQFVGELGCHPTTKRNLKARPVIRELAGVRAAGP
jgi:Mg2+/Co2+ transporter CorB